MSIEEVAREAVKMARLNGAIIVYDTKDKVVKALIEEYCKNSSLDKNNEYFNIMAVDHNDYERFTDYQKDCYAFVFVDRECFRLEVPNGRMGIGQ